MFLCLDYVDIALRFNKRVFRFSFFFDFKSPMQINLLNLVVFWNVGIESGTNSQRVIDKITPFWLNLGVNLQFVASAAKH